MRESSSWFFTEIDRVPSAVTLSHRVLTGRSFSLRYSFFLSDEFYLDWPCRWPLSEFGKLCWHIDCIWIVFLFLLVICCRAGPCENRILDNTRLYEGVTHFLSGWQGFKSFPGFLVVDWCPVSLSSFLPRFRPALLSPRPVLQIDSHLFLSSTVSRPLAVLDWSCRVGRPARIEFGLCFFTLCPSFHRICANFIVTLYFRPKKVSQLAKW